MRNSCIRKKLLIGFLIVAIATAIVGATGIWGLSNLWSNEDGLHATAVRCINAKELEQNLSAQHLYYGAGILSIHSPGTVENYIHEIQKLDDEFLAIVAYLGDTILKPESRDLALRIEERYINSYSPIRDQLITALRSADEDMLRERGADILAHAGEIQAMATTLSEQGYQQMEQLAKEDAYTAAILTVVMILIALFSVAVAIWLGNHISSRISRPVKELVQAAQKLTIGDIDIALDIGSEDELGTLAREFEKMIAAIREQADALQSLASGNYTVDIPIRSDSDVANRAMQELISRSNAVLREVAMASMTVSSSGEQISQEAVLLASGSEEQAASIEQFTVSLEDFLAQTKRNAGNAHKALNTTTQVSDLIHTSMECMAELLDAMGEMLDSSESIGRISKMMEDIAFQTNILALNASVEAAHAGQHGKGFSAVAIEVKKLALRSAAAAKEVSELAAGSAEHMEQGNEIVKKTSESLQAVSEHSAHCLWLIREIAEASTAQVGRMQYIQQDINNISQIVQSNSVSSQQSATAAENMAAQSRLLKQLVSRFQLKEIGLVMEEDAS